MIKVGDVVVSNGTIANVESYLGNKPHEVLEVGKMAGVSFDMVWLDGKAIPCPADGLRVVSEPMTSMPDHNRAAFDAAHELELSKNASQKGADFGQLGDCAKLREALEYPKDANDKYIHIGDAVHMLNTDHEGDHEWDDIVVSFEYVGKGGGDDWLVYGEDGAAWACECEVLKKEGGDDGNE